MRTFIASLYCQVRSELCADLRKCPALDPAFNYAALPFAPKTWVTEDPAQRYTMMQSSPIVIPARVNAALSATVCPTLISTPLPP